MNDSYFEREQQKTIQLLLKEIAPLRAINDELLSALREIVNRLDWVEFPGSMECNILQIALNAIDKAQEMNK